MNDFYFKKASLPRAVMGTSTLREAMGLWGTQRLLNVSRSCEESGAGDKYRREFGRIHSRYAEMTFLISEAMSADNLKYTAETLLHWIADDFKNAETGAQKDAAGLCGAELTMMIEKFKWRKE